MSDEGNIHLGVSSRNVVYLTVSPSLQALSILIAQKTEKALSAWALFFTYSKS